MDRNAVIEFLGDDWKMVMDLIRSSLDSDISLLKTTNESILSHSGKQLRPMLSLLVAKACNGGSLNDESIRYAAAAELLHNATLLHDDVADASETRRGAPTVASTLGNVPSVLIGDFWLVKAVDLVLNTGAYGNNVAGLFAETLRHLAEGEMLQLQKAYCGDTSEADYFKIIFSKTASLFEAACRSAAMSVDAPEPVRKAVGEYAVKLGLAFQIKDDMMDYEGGDIGKPAGVDLKEQKITLPLLGAFHNAPDETERLVRQMVCGIPQHPENVERIITFVKEYNGMEYAADKLHSLCDEAVAALSVLPDSRAKEYLKELAYYTADRKK